MNPLANLQKVSSLYAAGLRAIGMTTHGGKMKQLPEFPHFFHLKKQAKELLRAYKENDSAAIQRFLEFLPSAHSPAQLAGRELHLHDAQSCVAREYGFASWTELRAHVENQALLKLSREDALKRWLQLVYGEGYNAPRPALAISMLSDRPDLLGDDPYLACIVGNETRVSKMLATNPDWVHKAGGPLQMQPLIAVTHSALVRDASFAGVLVNCARLLLDSGANPDQTWTNPEFPDWPLSAIYGAAGKNHHPAMTKLLLERGANPNDNESLYHSMESKDLTCTRMLLEAGAKVDGTNAIGHALDYDRPEAVRLLLQYGGNAGHPGASDYPIFHAIRRGRSIEHIQILLDGGADKNVRNAHGQTPYQFALLYGQPKTAALLQDPATADALSTEDAFVAACARGDHQGVAKHLFETPNMVHRLSEKHLKQLPNLAAQGNFAAVKTMVEAGWPVKVRGGDWNASALNLAVYLGDVQMTEFLLDHGADWQEKHGFGGNAMGTLGYASNNNAQDLERGDWLGCAKTLIAHGMPVPSNDYQFSDDVTEYFESLGGAAEMI
ncbi:MAG: ankyrin repeat domain-containing protein [Alloacidobacterium sp.]